MMFNRETKNKTSLLLCRPHNKSDVFVSCLIYRRSTLFKTRQVGKVVKIFNTPRQTN